MDGQVAGNFSWEQAYLSVSIYVSVFVSYTCDYIGLHFGQKSFAAVSLEKCGATILIEL